MSVPEFDAAFGKIPRAGQNQARTTFSATTQDGLAARLSKKLRLARDSVSASQTDALRLCLRASRENFGIDVARGDACDVPHRPILVVCWRRLWQLCSARLLHELHSPQH